MTQKAPGKSHREGISLIQLFKLFPDEQAAEDWIEVHRWGKDRENIHCPHCGSTDKIKARESRKPMPWHCGDCRKYFSVRTGTCMAQSRIPLQKWVFAIYLHMTSLKGVSSMKLHRELDITQKSAWFLSHRIRMAYEHPAEDFAGPVEVDETYMGGKRRNMSNSKRKELAGTGRGSVGKTAVAGIKDRDSNRIKATVVPDTSKTTLQDFIHVSVEEGTKIYTDESKSYNGLSNHETVNHSVSEYVNGMAHTNGIESFWATLKRGYHGTFHHMSPEHLHRYVNEFAMRHNMRDSDTVDMMNQTFAGMIGKRLMYRDLTANNLLENELRS